MEVSRPKLKSKTDVSITVAWSAPGRVDCSGYDLEMKTTEGDWSVVWSGNEISKEVEGLESATQYYFRVRARNGEKFGEWSQDSFYSTHLVSTHKPASSKAEPPTGEKKEAVEGANGAVEKAEKKMSKKEKKKAAKAEADASAKAAAAANREVLDLPKEEKPDS